MIVALWGVSAFAQTAVTYSNDFQSYALQADAAGWVDTSTETTKSHADHLFKTWPDPQQAGNVVYGVKPAAGSLIGSDPRTGRFSTYAAVAFNGKGHFEYRGRFLRTSAKGQLGLTFFASLPETIAAYVVGLRQEPLGAMTMQLFAIGGEPLAGTIDSHFTPEANRWYDFRIEADDTGVATTVRARFWPHDAPEPGTFSIDASDTSGTRLTTGRIGIWAAANSAAYVDDLVATSQAVEQAASGVTFLNASTHAQLDPSKLALFKGPGTLQLLVRGSVTSSTLDGEPVGLGAPVSLGDGIVLYTLPPIVVDGVHTLAVHAGGVDATLRFLVDQQPPVVTLRANSAPVADGTIFDANVTMTADVADVSETTRTLTIDGVATSLPATIAAEALHHVSLTVIDQVGWSTTVSTSFIVDKSAPVVTITANGSPLLAGATFNAPVTLGWTIDDLTFDPAQVSATLDGAPVAAGSLVSSDAIHSIVVTATDKAHHTTALTRNFTIDRQAPPAQLFANSAAFTDGLSFNAPVVFSVTADATATTAVTVDGAPYSLGSAVADEKRDHSIKVVITATTNAVTTLGPYHFSIDFTKPVIVLTVGGQPFAEGMLFNRDVLPVIAATDNFTAVPSRKLAIDGHDFPIDTLVVEEKADHTISATATDDAGNVASIGPFHFGIDKTPPVIAFTAPQPNSVVAPPLVTVQGSSDDAVTMTVADRPIVPTAGKTFVASDVALLEGRNEIVAAGTDRAGNIGTATLVVNLDTRVPDLTITSPLANVCLNATQINVSGRVFDPHIAGVKVSISPSAPINATIAADGAWTATVNAPAEGRYTVIAEGSDSVGHAVTATLPVTVDTTAPFVQLTESGGIVNHPMSIAFRAIDTDASAVATATLNGQPYISSTPIATDGDYTLRVTARDCAGNISDVRVVTFTIDTVPPSIVSMAPSDGGNAGNAQQTITGSLDADDVASVVISGTTYAAAISGRTFTFAGISLAEGTNRLSIVATDRAGNTSTKAYVLNVKSTVPVVDILESGASIAAGALFNRPVAPVVRVTESAVNVTATLNGNPFTSGATISADGSYTLRATASDGFGHTSAEASATFTIDTTAPVVKITSPATGGVVHLDHVDVRGTVSGGDLANFSVGGSIVTIAADGSFVAAIHLDNGPNVVAATALDRAGNSGSDVITITSDAGRAGIILTLPADQVATNRTTTPVVGQVLTPSLAASVTLNGSPIAIDSTGVFRKPDLALIEGDNAITATVTDQGGTTNSVTVHVPADFTPPHLRVLANGAELAAGARFATGPLLTLDASDGGGSVTTSLTIDGVVVAAPFTPASNGGHSLVAIARDLAGNETRIDRTFSIGDTSGVGGCPPASFDPADRSSLFADHVMLIGRAAASSVLVGSALVPVVDGAFATSIPLNVEGANAISIACADASGRALGAPSTLTLFRYTNAPSVTITSPTTDSELTASKTQVAFTVGAGVASGDVNGITFTVSGDPSVSHSLTIDNVPIANGLNVITVRALNTAGRTGFASVQVRRYAGEPQLTITSPLPGTQTGAATISVSGAFVNIDPATLAVTSGSLSYPVQIRSPRRMVRSTCSMAGTSRRAWR